MDFLELADIVERTAPPEIERTPEKHEALHSAYSTFDAEGYDMTEDEGVASLIAVFALDQDDEDDEDSSDIESLGKSGGEEDVDESEFDKGLPITQRVIRWFMKRIIKKVALTGARLIMKSIWRLVSWFAKEVVIGAFRMAGRFLARTVIVEGIAALVAAGPAAWAGAAGAALLGGLGYYIYKRYFEGSSAGDYNPEQAREEAQNFGQNTVQPISYPDFTPSTTGYQSSAAPTASSTRQPVTGPALTGGAQSIGTGRVYSRGEVRRFKDLIARGEGDYNSVNYGATHGYRSGHEDLIHMTLAEVQQHQHNRDFNAAGRYQMMGYPAKNDTLGFAIKALNLDTNKLFDPQMQDMIFDQYLANKKHPQIEAYLTGRSDNLYAALLATSQEWASVAAPRGATIASPKRGQPGRISDGNLSYYADIGKNKAFISAEEMAASLQYERAVRTGTVVDSGAQESKPGTTVAVQQAPAQAPTAAPASRSGVQTGTRADATIVMGPKGVPVKLK